MTVRRSANPAGAFVNGLSIFSGAVTSNNITDGNGNSGTSMADGGVVSLAGAASQIANFTTANPLGVMTADGAEKGGRREKRLDNQWRRHGLEMVKRDCKIIHACSVN